jgi:uncharacterized protein YggU (UPF0235/DUF167 family)
MAKGVADFADLSALAAPGAVLTVRVTPRARVPSVRLDQGQIAVHVAAPPADGAANAAVLTLLARALGVAPSRLTLLRGAASRIKQVRVD